MASVKKFSRELAPHAAWRGIELLWDLVRAGLLVALVGFRQWFAHHWDIVTLALVFLACLGLLIWRDFSHRGDYPDSAGGKPVTGTNEASNGQWKYPFHPRSGEMGPRIEHAAFGAAGDQPHDVTDKVKSLLTEGKEIRAKWQTLLGFDPHEDETKYLTVTLSTTEAEGGLIKLPLSSVGLPPPSKPSLPPAKPIDIAVVSRAPAEIKLTYLDAEAIANEAWGFKLKYYVHFRGNNILDVP